METKGPHDRGNDLKKQDATYRPQMENSRGGGRQERTAAPITLHEKLIFESEAVKTWKDALTR